MVVPAVSQGEPGGQGCAAEAAGATMVVVGPMYRGRKTDLCLWRHPTAPPIRRAENRPPTTRRRIDARTTNGDGSFVAMDSSGHEID